MIIIMVMYPMLPLFLKQIFNLDINIVIDEIHRQVVREFNGQVNFQSILPLLLKNSILSALFGKPSDYFLSRGNEYPQRRYSPISRKIFLLIISFSSNSVFSSKKSNQMHHPTIQNHSYLNLRIYPMKKNNPTVKHSFKLVSQFPMPFSSRIK